MPLQISTFKIPELVGEVKAELEPIIMRSKLAVTLDLPKDLQPICERSAEGEADPAQPAEQRAQVHAPRRRHDQRARATPRSGR